MELNPGRGPPFLMAAQLSDALLPVRMMCPSPHDTCVGQEIKNSILYERALVEDETILYCRWLLLSWVPYALVILYY